MKKFSTLSIALLFVFVSQAQFSLSVSSTYMTDNQESQNWGFTIKPAYQFSHKLRLGLNTSFFLDGNYFPQYIGQASDWNNANIKTEQAHRILPINLSLDYYLLKNKKSRIQPNIQLNAGAVIVGTFANATIVNPAYFQYKHEVDTYFDAGIKVGCDVRLLPKFHIAISGGYNRIFGDDKNRFSNATLDLSDYNLPISHYFIFSAGLKYEFGRK